MDKIQEGVGSSVGEILRQAREDKKQSLEEVSKATKISIKILKALEAEDLSQLPSGIYTRVFVKKYGTYLGVGPQAMERYEKSQRTGALAAPLVRPETPLTSASPRAGISRLRQKWIMVCLLMFASVLLLAWFLKPKSPHVITVAALSPQISVPAAKKEIALPAAIEPRAPARIMTKPAQPARIEAVKEGLYLEVLALDKVWLRVKADNLLLFEGTIAKGERESWRAQREFLMRVGSAGAVSIYLNDRELNSIGNKGEVKTVVINKEGIVKTR